MQVLRKYYSIIIIITVLTISCGKKKGPHFLFEGNVTSITGAVQIYKPEASKWVTIAAADDINFGDSIRTPVKSQVEITFAGKNTVTIGENSKVAFSLVKDSADKDVAEVYTVFGSVLSDVKKVTAKHYQHYQVKTLTSTVSVDGTLFFVMFHLHKRITHVNVFRGRVRVRNPHVIKGPPLILVPGFFTVVHAGRVPVVPKKLNYGQMKKVMPLMPPGQYKKFYKKYKIKRIPMVKPVKGFKAKAPKAKAFKVKAIKQKGVKKSPHKQFLGPKKKILKKGALQSKPGKKVPGKIIPKKKKGPKRGKKK